MADSRDRATYRTGTSNDRLVPLHVRFRNSTRDDIKQISDDMKWTKASTVRYLVEIGLKSGIVTSKGSRSLKCVNCGEKMQKASNTLHMCKNCGNRTEVIRD
jgi:phosphoribosylamine-glycine ligase